MAVAKQPHGQVSQPWQAGKESAVSARSVHFQASLCPSETDVAKETLSAQVSKMKPQKQRSQGAGVPRREVSSPWALEALHPDVSPSWVGSGACESIPPEAGWGTRGAEGRVPAKSPFW